THNHTHAHTHPPHTVCPAPPPVFLSSSDINPSLYAFIYLFIFIYIFMSLTHNLSHSLSLSLSLSVSLATPHMYSYKLIIDSSESVDKCPKGIDIDMSSVSRNLC